MDRRAARGAGTGVWRRLLPVVALAGCAVRGDLLAYRVVGDAIPEPLVAAKPDPERGRAVVTSRDGNCTLCHALPASGVRAAGNLGPSLAGVGARLDAGQLRLRLVDAMRLNPHTIMPSYYRVDGLNRVAQSFRGKPILDAQQIEDAIAYLQSLR